MTNTQTEEQINLYLVSQQKTIRYARALIIEGDFITGKSMLDSTLKQLTQKAFESYPDELEKERLRLADEARQVIEGVKEMRKNRQKLMEVSRKMVVSQV